jgi:hypothetical protein
MKKVLLVTEEERNLNRKKRIFIKNRPYRMKITPLGLGDFKKDDESITYRRGNKVWYKAHPEAKLELLYFNGLAIWNYNEFLIDVDYEGKPCRIFFNPISGKFLANEIVSHNYDGKGMVLLKNPSNKVILPKILKILFDEGKENEWLDTLREARSQALKEKHKIKRKKSLKPRGRPQKENIKKAVIWCLNALDNKVYKNRKEAIKESYNEFGEKDVPLKSFTRTVGEKINIITNSYNKKPLNFRRKNPRTVFAENFCFAQTRLNPSLKQKK